MDFMAKLWREIDVRVAQSEEHSKLYPESFNLDETLKE